MNNNKKPALKPITPNVIGIIIGLIFVYLSISLMRANRAMLDGSFGIIPWLICNIPAIAVLLTGILMALSPFRHSTIVATFIAFLIRITKPLVGLANTYEKLLGLAIVFIAITTLPHAVLELISFLKPDIPKDAVYYGVLVIIEVALYMRGEKIVSAIYTLTKTDMPTAVKKAVQPDKIRSAIYCLSAIAYGLFNLELFLNTEINWHILNPHKAVLVEVLITFTMLDAAIGSFSQTLKGRATTR